MEFGIFVQMPLLGASAHDPAAEHEAMQLDIDMIVEADRHGFKYAWVSEHHGLTEYSHLSASESFIPYCFPLTERIHLGSGIWPTNPAQNHPVRLAERVAMCDNLSKGRFEFGCGRGAGSHEIGTLRPEDLRDQGRVGRGHLGVQEDVGVAPSTPTPGPAFTVPRAQHPPQALRRRRLAPADLGGGRQHRRPTPRPAPTASACSASPSARSTRWARRWRPTRRPWPTPRRSASS